MNLSAHEKKMLRSFVGRSRYWRSIPDTACRLWDKKLIEPTKFGMGNFQLSGKGRAWLEDNPS